MSILISGSPKEAFIFNSYNFPEYSIGIENDNEGYIIQDNDYRFMLVSPGLTGQIGSVSLESEKTPGYYLRHENFLLYLHQWDSSDSFQESATFIMNEGTFYEVRLIHLYVFQVLNWPIPPLYR